MHAQLCLYFSINSSLLERIGLRGHQIRNWGVELCLKLGSDIHKNICQNLVKKTGGNMRTAWGEHNTCDLVEAFLISVYND